MRSVCAAPLAWIHIVHVVKHEMYPKLASVMQAVVDAMPTSFDRRDLSERAAQAVVEAFKKQRSLTNREISYIRDLVRRARSFRWDTSHTGHTAKS